MKISCFIFILTLIMTGFMLSGFKKPPHKHSPQTQAILKNDKQQPKPLELNLPSTTLGLPDLPETLADSLIENEEILTNEDNKDKTLELQGRFIMSQEPEVEKMKSTDGAGIIINLHH